MVFSSLVFVCVFLPICLLGYHLIKANWRNLFLLGASLIFYAWGEPKYIVWMMFSIFMNYAFGCCIDYWEQKNTGRLILTLCILTNLGALVYFKYLNFLIENLNLVLNGGIQARNIIMPIGISFYTFQAMSYVVDVYRGKHGTGQVKCQKNIIDLGLYIACFPQLVAGPIVKYSEIEKQLKNRTTSFEDVYVGARIFIVGIAKKMLIANTLAVCVDEVFALEASSIGTLLAWTAMICYTLQIYYDFSGYSDMAIGLGRMFGFTFPVNFNYPYLSKSIREFWKRWHISLSSWFRDYLYIPLGGSRCTKSKKLRNLLIVFVATGIWHGANWTFLLWGLFHGVFVVLEHGSEKFNNFLKKGIIGNIYSLLVVSFAWILFRADTLSYAIAYLKNMFFPTQGAVSYGLFVNWEIILTIIIGILGCGILKKWDAPSLAGGKGVLADIGLMLIFVLCMFYMVSGAYNPFIYFRF